jgi:hypothetical protein
METPVAMSTHIVAVEESVVRSVRQILVVARETLQQQRCHIPTAVLHTLDGMIPIVLPYESTDERNTLVDYVKEQALERHAYAVTTVTAVRVLDSRTGEEEEALVLATAVQGGRPHVVVQKFFRDGEQAVERFGDVVEGDEAAGPGQMIIFPDWHEERYH